MTVTTPKKDGNQWFDVGIIKGTSCLVSYYHLPAEGQQDNAESIEKRVGPHGTGMSFIKWLYSLLHNVAVNGWLVIFMLDLFCKRRVLVKETRIIQFPVLPYFY